MTSPENVRAIAKEVFDAACHARELERIREYGQTDSMAWPEEDLEGNYSSIIAEFEKFTGPDPARFREMAEHLRGALDLIVLGDAALLDADLLNLGGWVGTAKRKFEENYVAKWDSYRDAHAQLVDSLITAVEGHAVLYEGMWARAYEIGEVARDALRGIDSWPLWLSESEGADLFVKVAGVLTAGAAQGVIANVKSALSFSVVVADAAVATSKAVGTVEGKWVHEILALMFQQLRQLDAELVAEEEEVKGAMTTNLVELDKNFRLVVPPEPELAKIDPENPGEDLELA